MGRRTRLVRYDGFTEMISVERVRDDRSLAKKVKEPRDLQKLTTRQGAVSDYLYQSDFLDYKPDGSVTVKKSVVVNEANALVKGIEDTRFYGVREVERNEQEQANEYGVSPRVVRNLAARDAQVKALGVLAAAKAGGVKISSYQKGILNKLAEGKYTGTIFGNKDSEGKYKYERGTFASQLGIGKGSGGYSDSGFNAGAKEQAQILREYRYGEENLERAARDVPTFRSGVNF